jgi:phosphoglucosamine mutase
MHAGTDPLGHDDVKAAIAEGEAQLTGTGRVLIRKSGTEPLIRVMAEAEDEALMARVVEEIALAVDKAG